MTAIFDGLTGVLNQVFGAPVIVTDKAGISVTLTAVFREEPVDIYAEDGRPTQFIKPTLRVLKSDLPRVAKGFTVRPPSVAPRRFTVIRVLPSTSPAADGFTMCELEEAAL